MKHGNKKDEDGGVLIEKIEIEYFEGSFLVRKERSGEITARFGMKVRVFEKIHHNMK